MFEVLESHVLLISDFGDYYYHEHLVQFSYMEFNFFDATLLKFITTYEILSSNEEFHDQKMEHII